MSTATLYQPETEHKTQHKPRASVHAGLLTALQAVQAQVIASEGSSSPAALKLQTIIEATQRTAKLARDIARGIVRKLILQRAQRAALWRLLMEIWADGGPRTEPPLGVYAHEPAPAGVPPWSPWTGLAPPAVPQLIQRQ
jgi:hypothetical protein